ncbi:MAG: hybrid sensor histidine kinase/response regulator [Oscillatoria sp. PMC 1068.18]|nr:hybrid sensor histidine kinase/response regulator [Oscillatoria sp. PMC 1076.18]MEC4991536.1 hybrid sensor histidine kinase/response regulator [Oscillatoria sp. PMC 1068.18]
MLRILIIDDNSDDRILIIRELKREFAEIKSLQIIDNQDFQHALAAGDFDLVVTDYQVRWSNGLKIVEEIKKFYPDCPVVMFTNSGNEEIAVAAMKAGLDDYVTKSPTHYLRLSKAVNSVWQRTQAQQQVSRLQTELDSLLNDLSVGVFRANLEGKLLSGNAAFLQILGVEKLSQAEKLLATQPRDLQKLYFPDKKESFQVANNRGIQHQEIQLWRADKQEIWIDLSRKFRTYKGEIVIDGLIEDISERKKIEAEKAQLLKSEQKARTEAERLNRIKDEFLANLSHELRTPMNSILGWSQLLRSGNLSQEKIARALQVIERNAKAQMQLIKDLLDVSQIIRGKTQLSVQPINLCEAIEAALDTVRPAAEAKQISLDMECSSQMIIIIGDGDRLQQVFWNLLVNAIKYTPEQGFVKAKIQSNDRHAEVQVMDTGRGISSKFLPYVFDRFSQVDSSSTRLYGGLGLGLAIVRHLVELHGGTVSAYSEGEEQGSIFTIKLPLLRQQPQITQKKLNLRTEVVSGSNE